MNLNRRHICFVAVLLAGCVLAFGCSTAQVKGDAVAFFDGCTIIPEQPGKPFVQVRGRCLGHVFSNEGVSLAAPCLAQTSTSKPNSWDVQYCNIDGNLIQVAHFDGTGKRLTSSVELKGYGVAPIAPKSQPSGAETTPALAQTNNEVSIAPGAPRTTRPSIVSGAGWYPCLVTAQCNDRVVGSGPVASNSLLAARVRIATWQYAADAVEFKGPRIATHLDNNQLGYLISPYQGGTGTADALVGMRVGGQRVIAVAPQQFVFEVELLELAPYSLGSAGAVLPNFRGIGVLWQRASDHSDAERYDESRRRSRGEKYVGDYRLARVIEDAVRKNRLCSGESSYQPSKARTAIFGLVVGDPLPCLNACKDQNRKDPHTFVCLADFKPTPWGTQRADFNVSDEHFDTGAVGWFGPTSLEVSQGTLVGIILKGISLQNAQKAVIELLTSKFGAASVKGSTYLWSTPSASVRYVTDDDNRSPLRAIGQVDLEHPFGEGIAIGETIVQGTVTVFSPELRSRIQEFDQGKAEQAKRMQKPSF